MKTRVIPDTAIKLPFSIPEMILITAGIGLATDLIGMDKTIVKALDYGAGISMAAWGIYGMRNLSCNIKSERKFVNLGKQFGVEPVAVTSLLLEERIEETHLLVEKVNDEYTPNPYTLSETALLSNREVTTYLASLIEEEVITSSVVRGKGILNSIIKLLLPAGVAATDPFTGDIYVVKRTGVLEPFVLAHELVHRQFYIRELDAQVLGYLSLKSSSDGVLRLAADAGLLYEQCRVIAEDRDQNMKETITALSLRREIADNFRQVAREGIHERVMSYVTMPLMRVGMWLRGSSFDDYDSNFTDYIHALKGTPLRETINR